MDINGALYNMIRIDMKIYFMQRVLPILDRVKFFFIWNFAFFFYPDDTEKANNSKIIYYVKFCTICITKYTADEFFCTSM